LDALLRREDRGQCRWQALWQILNREGISAEADARLGGLGFTFSKRESQPVPLAILVADPQLRGNFSRG